MKTRKAKAAAKGKVFLSKRKLKGNLPLDVSDSGSDIDDESLFHDEIDNFHKNEEDQLSTDDELIQHRNEPSDEEEVLPISNDESDDTDDDNLKDDDDVNDDYDLPNREAWGKKKSAYYDADFVDQDRGKSYREKDEEAAKAEEAEAKAIQKSVFANCNTDGLKFVQMIDSSESSGDEGEKVSPKYEKLKYLKKTSSDASYFRNEFIKSMREIRYRVLPLLNLVLNGTLTSEEFGKYIKTKYHVLLHYCLNISFYFLWRSSKPKVEHHPVFGRIAEYKKILDQLKVTDEACKDGIDNILEKLENNEEIVFHDAEVQEQHAGKLHQSMINGSAPVSPKDEDKSKDDAKPKKSKRKNIETQPEKEILSLITNMREEIKRRKSEKSDKKLPNDEPVAEDAEEIPEQVADLSEEKRTVTYEVAKNKGLVAQRKKEYRNPRVRNKKKYTKAKIRRKGQVRDVIKEIRRYEGEPTGISTHVVKSIKFK